MGCSGVDWVSTRSYGVEPDVDGFYWVLLGFTGLRTPSSVLICALTTALVTKRRYERRRQLTDELMGRRQPMDCRGRHPSDHPTLSPFIHPPTHPLLPIYFSLHPLPLRLYRLVCRGFLVLF